MAGSSLLLGILGSGTRLNLYSLDDFRKGGIAIHPLIPRGASSPVITDVPVSSDGRSGYFMAASDEPWLPDEKGLQPDVTGE
jgi:hypothetical protein